MNKVLYTIGIVLALVFIGTSAYYVSEVSSARINEIFRSFNSPDTNYYPTFYSEFSSVGDLTREAALISMFFLLYFIATDIFGLVKVKTKTSLVLSIIGISLGVIFLLWDLAVLSSPAALSFDEVGGAFILYALSVLAFAIVGLIQSMRFANQQNKVGNPRTDLLDS